MTEDSFILMNLKDSKEVTAAMQNDTAQKILDFLTKGDATETIIAQELGIPLSTAHYNLQQLKKAKLVKTSEYHYSKKGKEVLHYSLAKKLIIIAPGGNESNLKSLLKKVLPSLGFLALSAYTVKFFSQNNNFLLKSADTSIKLRNSAETEMLMMADSSVKSSFWPTISNFEWFILGASCIVAILLIIELISNKKWFKLKKH